MSLPDSSLLAASGPIPDLIPAQAASLCGIEASTTWMTPQRQGPAETMLARGWGALNLRGWEAGNLGCLPCSPPFSYSWPVCWGRGAVGSWLLAAGVLLLVQGWRGGYDGQEQGVVEAGKSGLGQLCQRDGHLLGFPETERKLFAEGLVRPVWHRLGPSGSCFARG